MRLQRAILIAATVYLSFHAMAQGSMAKDLVVSEIEKKCGAAGCEVRCYQLKNHRNGQSGMVYSGRFSKLKVIHYVNSDIRFIGKTTGFAQRDTIMNAQSVG